MAKEQQGWGSVGAGLEKAAQPTHYHPPQANDDYLALGNVQDGP